MHVDSLFGPKDTLPSVPQLHPVYVHISESKFCAEDRRIIDEMWMRYRAYVRPSFTKDLMIDFPSRVWELQLVCSFLDMGLKRRRADRFGSAPVSTKSGSRSITCAPSARLLCQEVWTPMSDPSLVS